MPTVTLPIPLGYKLDHDFCHKQMGSTDEPVTLEGEEQKEDESFTNLGCVVDK